MDLELLLRGKGRRMSPALAIAQNGLRLLVHDKSVPFRACVFPLAFGLASLASGRFWCRASAHATVDGVKKKILFMCEAVTWSHVARLLVIARAQPAQVRGPHFASARFDGHLFHGASFTRWPMTTTLPADKIEAVVASGSIRRIYDKPVLEAARNEGAAAEGDHELVRLLLPTLPRIKPGNLAPILS